MLLWMVLGWERVNIIPKELPFDITPLDISAVITIASIAVSFMVNFKDWFLVLPIMIGILALYYLPIIIIPLAVFGIWKIDWKKPPDNRSPQVKI